MHLFVLLQNAEALDEALWQMPGVLGIEELPANGNLFSSSRDCVRFDQRQQFDDWLRTETFPVSLLKVYLDLPGDEALPAWLAQLPPCELVTYGTVVSCDYVSTVREQFHGYDVGQRFWVGPPWQTPPAGKLPVIIEPGMAFGLGDHPTTQMCLELLEQISVGAVSNRDRPPRRIFDIGTGTGVLAIAAGKLWPDAELWLSDHDPQCQSNVEHNFALNNLPVPSHQFFGNQPLPAGSFDLVLSNIFLDALCELAPLVADRLRGCWIVSGLLGAAQATEFRQVAAAHFDCIEIRQRPGEWFGLALRVRNRND